MQEIKVWDLLVRLLHWSLVAAVLGAWLLIGVLRSGRI